MNRRERRAATAETRKQKLRPRSGVDVFEGVQSYPEMIFRMVCEMAPAEMVPPLYAVTMAPNGYIYAFRFTPGKREAWRCDTICEYRPEGQDGSRDPIGVFLTDSTGTTALGWEMANQGSLVSPTPVDSEDVEPDELRSILAEITGGEREPDIFDIILTTAVRHVERGMIWPLHIVVIGSNGGMDVFRADTPDGSPENLHITSLETTEGATAGPWNVFITDSIGHKATYHIADQHDKRH